MNEAVEKVLVLLDEFRTNNEITYSAYSTLHDEISLLDDLLKDRETIVRCKDCKLWRSGLIDAVIDEIRKMPTIGGWISVKDRMPEKDKDVLVWLYGDYCIGRYDQDPDNLQMRWKFESFNLYEDDMSYITHWMPLPEPPEKEK